MVNDNGGKRRRLGISNVGFLRPFVRSESAVPRRSFLGSGLLWSLRRRGPPAVVLSSSASRHGRQQFGNLLASGGRRSAVFGWRLMFGRDLGLGFRVHGLGLVYTFYGLNLLLQVFRA